MKDDIMRPRRMEFCRRHRRFCGVREKSENKLAGERHFYGINMQIFPRKRSNFGGLVERKDVDARKDVNLNVSLFIKAKTWIIEHFCWMNNLLGRWKVWRRNVFLDLYNLRWELMAEFGSKWAISDSACKVKGKAHQSDWRLSHKGINFRFKQHHNHTQLTNIAHVHHTESSVFSFSESFFFPRLTRLHFNE